MQKIARICEAEIVEYYKDNLMKVYHEFFFSKEEAVKFCTGTVQMRLKEIKKLDVVTPGSLLEFMNDEEYQFKLCVKEFSAKERLYENRDGYVQAFENFVKNPSEGLYDQLLSVVYSNHFCYDYFGNVFISGPEPKDCVNFNEYGAFSEENCKDGKYTGSFFYYGYEIPKEELPYKTTKRRYWTVSEVYREPVNGDNGYTARTDMGTKYDEELDGYKDSVEYACGFPYDEMNDYFVDDKGFLMDITEEQEKEVFKEKAKDYSVKMRVISCDAIIFDSQKELAEYYAERVSSGDITEEEAYDFLLSLVKYEERYYDVEENLLRSRIVRQELDGTTEYDIIPDFSMETAKDVWKGWKKRKEMLHEIK